MARIKIIPETIPERQQKVLDIILQMQKSPRSSADKISLRGKNNPDSKKLFDWKYLCYDIDNIIICYDNFAPGYSRDSEEEIYRIVIGSYFKAKASI